MTDRPGYRYWWVNQSRAVTRGLMGDYLWAPAAAGGSAAESARCMQTIQPGDLIFAYADGAVSGVGLALRTASEAARPAELAAAGRAGNSPGWHLPVRFFELAVPLRLKPHMGRLSPLLPDAHAPLRGTGARNPAVYLAAIADAMADVLRQLLAGQLEDIEAQIKAAVVSELADDWVESSIRRRTDLEAGDKQQLIRARRGLGSFRASLEKIESACRVTGLLDRRHLRACHIKPWSVSEDGEKTDGANGLLLSPHVAHLFARGYISFSDQGDLLASGNLNPAILTAWSLRMPMKVGPFHPRQCVYLEYHRNRVFDQPEVGRGKVR
ncbi:MAG: HNH endonuclease signature motif containing protein [Steroidobacteraceae bacterium]